eukprot:g10767.t1
MVHPDKAGGSKATFIELTDAHDRILERLAPNANTFGALEGERAMVLRRILNDVAKDEWKARLRRESAGTLRALKAQLLGTAASARGRKRAVAALGDDERAADAPTATIRGIMRKVKHGQIRYHLRMSSQGLILETEESQDLDEVLEVRSELMLLKGAAGAARREARGDGAVPEEAWKVFGRSSALLFFTAEAGPENTVITAKTCDIDTAIDFGQRLRAATRTSGKAAVSPEQKRQKEELLARRRCAASTDASLQLVAFIEALQESWTIEASLTRLLAVHDERDKPYVPSGPKPNPSNHVASCHFQAPPVTRRLIGKQPPPQRLAITPAVAAQPALEDAPPLPAPSQAAGQGPAAQASRATRLALSSCRPYGVDVADLGHGMSTGEAPSLRRQVLLLRHGQSRHNAAAQRDTGARDPLLSELGLAQAARLRGMPIFADCELLVVSPLSRALQTAAAAFGERPEGTRVVLSPLHSERWCSISDEGRSKHLGGRALRSSRTIGRRAATTRRPGAARGSQPFSSGSPPSQSTELSNLRRPAAMLLPTLQRIALQGETAAAVDCHGGLYIFDLKRRERVRLWQEAPFSGALCFVRAGELLFSVQHKVRVLDAQSLHRRPLRTTLLQHQEPVTFAAASENWATTLSRDRLLLWEVGSWTLHRRIVASHLVAANLTSDGQQDRGPGRCLDVGEVILVNPAVIWGWVK